MRGLKRERILRVLLTETKPLSKNELSKKAQCTRQWVILFLRELEKKKLVKETKVINSTGLIRYWLTLHKKPKKYREYMVKEHKKIKDLCDIFVLLWYSEEKPQELKDKINQFTKKQNIQKIIKTINREDYQKVGLQLNHTSEEIQRVFGLLKD